MKKIFAILLLFVTIFGFSQDKKISGYFVDETNKDTIIYLKHYHIYLLRDLNTYSKAKKILETKNEKFEISISKIDLRKYPYLEFESKNGNAIYVINKIPNDSILIAKVGENPNYNPNLEIVGAKPAIYLYPTVKTEISVKNDCKGKVMNTYPLYKNGWNVIAEPNGTFYNLNDKRTYNYLFWDFWSIY